MLLEHGKSFKWFVKKAVKVNHFSTSNVYKLGKILKHKPGWNWVSPKPKIEVISVLTVKFLTSFSQSK